MLKTKSRSQVSGGYSVYVDFNRRYQSTTDPSLLRGVYTAPITQDQYEECTDQEDAKYQDKWNSFQHYRRWTVPLKVLQGFPHCFPLRGMYSKPYVGTNRCPDLLYKWTAANPTTGHGELWLPITGLTAFYSKDASTGNFIPVPVQLEALKQRAFNSILPQIKSELSLINSVIELKDFSTLPKTMRGLANLGFKGYKTLRHYLKAGADGYLQQKFNLLPLLSDICGIRSALSRYEKRINDLITRSGKVRTSHWHWIGSEYPDDLRVGSGYILNTGQFSPYGIWANIKSYRQSIHDLSVFHVEMRYNYNYTAYQVSHAKLLALLDAFGVNLNPAIIWNAIPWSFVVDWVIGVSRYLDQYKTTNMEPKINIHRCLWSIKRRRVLRLYVKQYSTKWHAEQQIIYEQQLPTIVETAYRREVYMPSESSLQVGGLSPSEYSLAAALVIARRRVPRQRGY